MIPNKLSKSQVLRATLFRVWEQSKERSQGMDAETFYQRRLDQIIADEQRKLEPPLPTV